MYVQYVTSPQIFPFTRLTPPLANGWVGSAPIAVQWPGVCNTSVGVSYHGKWPWYGVHGPCSSLGDMT
jgi:hypothetical protein